MKKSYIFLEILAVIVAFVFGAIVMTGLVLVLPRKAKQVTNINKLEKEVTVTDKGIADAVENIYDATVVVITSKDGKAMGSGSGFVYKTDDKFAYIITNHHVVSVGNEFSITLSNEEIIKAKLVGSDPYADIAVLSVDKDKVISTAKLGSTDSLRVGDTVFAVGAPLDSSVYSFTVTRGILSGKDRVVEVSLNSSNQADWVMRVLQTDTAINSGNSGGPLCNSNGEVIGITNMKLAKTGVEGMGFAITIEDAIEASEAIISGKEKKYPYLGVSMYNVSSLVYTNSQLLKSDLTSGVYIYEVDVDSSAYKAGLRAGDVVIGIDKDNIKNVATLRYNLYKHSIGEKVTFKVNRDGEEKKIDIKLEAKK